MKARLLASALLLLLILPSVASASTARGLALPDLVNQSEVVLRGEVEATEAEWNGEYIVTRVTVRVADCVLGDCSETTEVVQVGGTVGDITMEVAGSNLLAAGDDVVLFLQINDAVEGLVPVGLSQGIFYATPEVDTLTRRLEDLVLIAPEGPVQGIGEVPAEWSALRAQVQALHAR